jgi:ribosomal-protein-alanine N-acetyltransferase
MNLDVRLATGADVDAIMAVMRNAFDPRFGEAWSVSQLTGSMSIPGTWAMVAQGPGGAVTGFTLTRLILDQAELLLVAVANDCRGNGCGRALLGAAADQARTRGAGEMFLEVRDGNDAALALYRKCGFTEIGRRKDYYSGATTERFDAITMRCLFSV